VLLGTADGVVELVTVQPPGKSPMAASSWMNGRRGTPAQFD
jgi:methionyl-tRNA formyltransferase